MNGEWVLDMVKEVYDLGFCVVGYVFVFYCVD